MAVLQPAEVVGHMVEVMDVVLTIVAILHVAGIEAGIGAVGDEEDTHRIE